MIRRSATKAATGRCSEAKLTADTLAVIDDVAESLGVTLGLAVSLAVMLAVADVLGLSLGVRVLLGVSLRDAVTDGLPVRDAATDGLPVLLGVTEGDAVLLTVTEGVMLRDSVTVAVREAVKLEESDGDSEGDLVGVTDRLGETLALAAFDGVRLAVKVNDAEMETVTDWEVDGDTDAAIDADGDTLRESEGDADSEGVALGDTGLALSLGLTVLDGVEDGEIEGLAVTERLFDGVAVSDGEFVGVSVAVSEGVTVTLGVLFCSHRARASLARLVPSTSACTPPAAARHTKNPINASVRVRCGKRGDGRRPPTLVAVVSITQSAVRPRSLNAAAESSHLETGSNECFQSTSSGESTQLANAVCSRPDACCFPLRGYRLKLDDPGKLLRKPQGEEI